MEYLGMQFKDIDELMNWVKDAHIKAYKEMANRFTNSPSRELSALMSDRADVLVNRFGLTWDEIEALETA